MVRPDPMDPAVCVSLDALSKDLELVILSFPARTREEELNAGYRAVARLYNAYLTGLILFIASRKGGDAAGRVIFQVYRQHHLNKFLSSFEKLGLSDKPHAVASAQYHYLSNAIGGVRVQFMPESDKKAWVRFVHPRWIYQGAAICGVPLEVSRAMLHGWYGHNGVSLKNPRLGFVCTSEDMDGQYGLAGYFLEHDHDLEESERVRFAPGEEPPPFDPELAPNLDVSAWPQERIEKANRNYAMDPVRLILPIMISTFGQDTATYLGRSAARLIGMQFYEELAGLLAISDDSAESFATFLSRLGAAQGDSVSWERDGDDILIGQVGWRLMRGHNGLSPAVFDSWNGLLEGALTTHNRFYVLEVLRRMDFGDDAFVWRLRRRQKGHIE